MFLIRIILISLSLLIAFKADSKAEGLSNAILCLQQSSSLETSPSYDLSSFSMHLSDDFTLAHSHLVLNTSELESD